MYQMLTHILQKLTGQQWNAIKKSIDLEPNNPRAHYQLGLAYLAISDKESSLEQYDILKSLDENYAKRLFEEIYK